MLKRRFSVGEALAEATVGSALYGLTGRLAAALGDLLDRLGQHKAGPVRIDEPHCVSQMGPRTSAPTTCKSAELAGPLPRRSRLALLPPRPPPHPRRDRLTRLGWSGRVFHRQLFRSGPTSATCCFAQLRTTAKSQSCSRFLGGTTAVEAWIVLRPLPRSRLDRFATAAAGRRPRRCALFHGPGWRRGNAPRRSIAIRREAR